MTPNSFLNRFPALYQDTLDPELENRLGPFSELHRKFLNVIDMAAFERLDIVKRRSGAGRPRKDRTALARAFAAKAVWNLSTTRALLDRLQVDRVLRRMCGWVFAREVPSESTFSRAFAEFAEDGLPSVVHECLVRRAYTDRVVGHASRDATAIEARERPQKGKGKEGKKESRLDRQPGQSLGEMLAELPKACDWGGKVDAKGRNNAWRGYKLHIDSADGEVPVSCILTSASMHDSQAAIPLAEQTRERVAHLYELMDSAYDAAAIRSHCEAAGQVVITERNPRRDKALKEGLAREKEALRLVGHVDPAKLRYKQRSCVERVNGRLKDEFGGRTVRVRGHGKVFAHLMFGVLALTAEQLNRIRRRC